MPGPIATGLGGRCDALVEAVGQAEGPWLPRAVLAMVGHTAEEIAACVAAGWLESWDRARPTRRDRPGALLNPPAVALTPRAAEALGLVLREHQDETVLSWRWVRAEDAPPEPPIKALRWQVQVVHMDATRLPWPAADEDEGRQRRPKRRKGA